MNSDSVSYNTNKRDVAHADEKHIAYLGLYWQSQASLIYHNESNNSLQDRSQESVYSED